MSSMLAIRSIDEEILSRGHEHRAEVLQLEAVPAQRTNALLLGLDEGAQIYHSLVVHFENTVPLLYEERFVNPRFGPHYLSQDFSLQTPSRYLSSISPLTEADQSVEAVTVDTAICRALRIRRGEPCLKLSRRTWCQRGVVNIATLIYPGSRYRLGGHLNF